MPVETLNDIVEEIADQAGVYGEQRNYYVSNLTSRINDAITIDRRLDDRLFHERMVKILTEATQNEQRNSD